jgi:PAS domain S-box-containing protein
VRADEGLRRRDELFRLTARTGLIMVYDIDPRSLKLNAMHGLTELLGYHMAEVESTLQWWDDRIHPDDLSAYRDAFRDMHSRPRARVLQYRMRHKEGSSLWVEDHATPVHDAQGRLERIIGTVRDITEHKRTQDSLLKQATELQRSEESLKYLNERLEQLVQERTFQLTAVNKELESFCYSVTHELGAPLRAMNCFSTILLAEHGGRLDGGGKDYLERIASAATRMGHLVEDLLMLSRVTRKTLVRVVVDMSTMVREITDALSAQDPSRQLEVLVAPDVKGEWDAALLRLLLQNLLGNAWKYTGGREGARIEFGSYESDGGTVYFVRDNGIGFDMAYAGKIFLPFERLHRIGEFEGTGIGLATAQRVIDVHGATIWAEAEPGKGATFYFTIKGGSGNG